MSTQSWYWIAGSSSPNSEENSLYPAARRGNAYAVTNNILYIYGGITSSGTSINNPKLVFGSLIQITFFRTWRFVDIYNSNWDMG